MGYMEIWVHGYERITGSQYMARESFTVSGATRTVSSVAVRLRRTSGTSPLALRLETSTGTLIEEVSVPAASIPISAPGGDNGGAVWVSATFATSHQLAVGQSYNLRLATAADTEYSVFVIRRGVEYGFDPRTWFADGVASYTTDGATWGTFGYYGTTHDGESDLQFYFR
jgi:hypothetical protein